MPACDRRATPELLRGLVAGIESSISGLFRTLIEQNQLVYAVFCPAAAGSLLIGSRRECLRDLRRRVPIQTLLHALRLVLAQV